MTILARSDIEQSIAGLTRPVDRGRARVMLGDGDPSDLREAMHDHQNPDGGYGHSLEPDLRLPDSSAIATTVAFQYLREAGATDDWPEVRSAVGYLVDTWNPSIPGWEAVPPEVDAHPRAPWWAHQGTADSFPANPGAEVFAVLLRHSSLVPMPLLTEAGAAVAASLDGLGPEIEPHEMLCWLRLTGDAPPGLAGRVVNALRRAVPAVVVVDPASWDRYLPGPLWVAPAPSSPLHADVAGHVGAHLDHLIAARSPHGSWNPAWTWGDDPAWPQAAQEWTSQLTVQALITLDAYGRLERL